ncbi:hypothetical protein JHK86_041399 [Glycine max]|nr:hypothetical protein JHK86_041399 [Glycine max]
MANCLMLLTKVGESETNYPISKGSDIDLSCHQELPNPTMKQQPRMHPCPICGLEFAIGQALGGHMRKHRTAINDGLLCGKPSSSLSILKESSKDGDQKLNLRLDLNLTPLEEDDLKLNLRTPVLNCFI